MQCQLLAVVSLLVCSCDVDFTSLWGWATTDCGLTKSIIDLIVDFRTCGADSLLGLIAVVVGVPLDVVICCDAIFVGFVRSVLSGER